MSDPAITINQAAQDAHELRAMYERWSFIIVPAVSLLVILLLIGASLIPTDYGKLVIARLKDVSGTVMEYIALLLGGTGLTMARGHMDQRIEGGQ